MSQGLESIAFAATSTFHGLSNNNACRKPPALASRRKRSNLRQTKSQPYMRHARPISRRTFTYTSLAGIASGILFPHGTIRSAHAVSSRFAAPDDLAQRLVKRVNILPAPKLYQSDIFYPEYFAGLWQTESTLLAVECPAGYKLFGRPGSFEAAKEEIDVPLRYKSRFVRSGRSVISDRPFNVTSIAKASMGPSAVLDCFAIGSTPNRLALTLRPKTEDGEVFNVDLRVIGRSQRTDSIPEKLERSFGVVRTAADIVNEEGTTPVIGLYTSETIRQEVRPNTNEIRVTPLIKDVETTTVFIMDRKDERIIEGWQKTNVYFSKSDLRYPDARGRPIDVRWYRLKYSRE